MKQVAPGDAGVAPVVRGENVPGGGVPSRVEVAVGPGRLVVFERSGEGACSRLEERLRRLGLRLVVRSTGPCG